MAPTKFVGDINFVFSLRAVNETAESGAVSPAAGPRLSNPIEAAGHPIPFEVVGLREPAKVLDVEEDAS